MIWTPGSPGKFNHGSRIRQYGGHGCAGWPVLTLSRTPLPAHNLPMRKILIALIPLLSCVWIAQRKALAKCDFSLHAARLVNADFSGFELEVKLKAKNPNDVDAVLDRLDYTLFMEGVEVAQGVVSEKHTIPRGGEGIITTRLKVKYSTIPKMADVVMAAVMKKKSKIRMIGTVHFDTSIGTISHGIEVERTVNLD